MRTTIKHIVALLFVLPTLAQATAIQVIGSNTDSVESYQKGQYSSFDFQYTTTDGTQHQSTDLKSLPSASTKLPGDTKTISGHFTRFLGSPGANCDWDFEDNYLQHALDQHPATIKIVVTHYASTHNHQKLYKCQVVTE